MVACIILVLEVEIASRQILIAHTIMMIPFSNTLYPFSSCFSFSFSFSTFLVAPRILTVGDPHRAFTAAKCLDGANPMAQKPEEVGPAVFYHASNRGFTTYTGRFKGSLVSIISIGMASVPCLSGGRIDVMARASMHPYMLTFVWLVYSRDIR